MPVLSLAGYVFVVTGASRGIGRQVALLLAGRGCRGGRGRPSQRRADRPAGEAPWAAGRLRAVAADVTASAAVEKPFAEVDVELGPMTLAVASGGTAGPPAPGDGLPTAEPAWQDGTPTVARKEDWT